MQQLQDEQLLRSLTPTRPGKRPGWIERAGQQMLDLASNDYLGLSRAAFVPDDPVVEDALHCHASTASRLVVGNHPIYPHLETLLSQLKGTEDAVVFGSGYAANTGTLAALVSRHDVVFSDRLNHASLIDGIRLSGARLVRYPHRDMDFLEEALRSTSCQGRRWIITDAVFSMDGTEAPLPEVVRLKQEYGAYLMLDEAHSAGVYGPNGAGLAHHHGLHRHVDILMGTLGKAYGAHGAYIAGDRVLIQYLMQTARSWMFTTALPPSVMARAHLNVKASLNMQIEREQLHQHARMFREHLRQHGLDTGQSSSQIVPLIVGSNAQAVQLGQLLQQAGIAAVPIRPPTVPRGTARIRFSLSAAHTPQDLHWAAETVVQMWTVLRGKA
ncbi:putative 8-amino-7-oxononanoate synthase [Deinococcus cellulosilyticus NBRC 106333 = KACC 11606]|uniref:8-amino-7-oxononanoate synthase n=1 Tax=Deinococcus cellulosilyticus (strain DSM 18568 / NBRC 106333 / KACC 11606 / 5516J-15) TaxID=1223518 RepID=A0A511MZM8_DEIC1|nr:putative 8-amino-7-oxononanoate synthase [Deinococcus cellulosilyticus NBRC 106333 = KACC 11606]